MESAIASDAFTDPRSRRRRGFNVTVGVVHLAQASAMLALSNDLALPVTAAFLPGDPVAAQGGTPVVLFDVPIGPAVAAFLLLAAADHLVVALLRARAWYERNLRRGVNNARWIEYSASASLMLVLIAMFTGIWDVAPCSG